MIVNSTKEKTFTKSGKNYYYSVLVECDYCGARNRQAYNYANKLTRHKCRKCAAKDHPNNFKKSPRIGVAPSNRQIKCLCVCFHCGKPTKPKTKRSLETSPKSFCGASCQIKWQNQNTKFNKENNNPSYRHGKRINGKVENYGNDWTSELRRNVKIRDGFNCQKCNKNFSGKLSKKLDVHHVDQDKYNNDSNNLISLCKSCHAKVHWEELNKGDK